MRAFLSLAELKPLKTLDPQRQRPHLRASTKWHLPYCMARFRTRQSADSDAHVAGRIAFPGPERHHADLRHAGSGKGYTRRRFDRRQCEIQAAVGRRGCAGAGVVAAS